MEAGAYMNQVRGVFSHNPLHDLESLWWVGVWFLLCHYHHGKLRDTTVQRHIEVVKKFGETLFNTHAYPLSRRLALTGPYILANIKLRFFPEAIQHFIVLLNVFREHLVTHYELYKPKTSQDRSFFIPALHSKFGDIVENARKKLSDDQTVLWLIGDNFACHRTEFTRMINR